MLLAQISDPHIKRAGALAYRRVDTAAYLARCVARLNTLDPRPEAVVVTGDLVDAGDLLEYEVLAKLLAPLAMPDYLLVGNHDDRTALRQVFGEHAYLRTAGNSSTTPSISARCGSSRSTLKCRGKATGTYAKRASRGSMQNSSRRKTSPSY